MQITIDITKPDELRKMKQELTVLLASIDAALAGIDAMPPQKLPLPVRQNGSSALPEPLNAVQAKFTMSEALLAADAVNLNRSTLRRLIGELVTAGKLIVEVPGSGRRPTTFRKAQDDVN